MTSLGHVATMWSTLVFVEVHICRRYGAGSYTCHFASILSGKPLRGLPPLRRGFEHGKNEAEVRAAKSSPPAPEP